jgi:hypothetical protein
MMGGGPVFALQIVMRPLRACLIASVIALGAGAAAQTAQPPPQSPQPPTTSVVGAEGKLVSLIFLPADAENVTRRIYTALLDRQPDADAFAASVAELQKGQLSQRLNAIVQTPEFVDRATMHSPAEMLDQIFTGMLDRRPTPAEAKTYLPQVQTRQYEQAMVKLITSSTFRAQAARDRANAGSRPIPPPAPPPAPPTTTKSTTSAPPTPTVVVPPPPPVPIVSAPVSPQGQVPPQATSSPTPATAVPETTAPPRPAPFPTARNASVNAPPSAPASLSPEWTRVLSCQEQVVDKLRTNPPRLVLVRFDAAEVNTSTVRGTAVNVLDNDRRLTYRCTGSEATLSSEPPSPGPTVTETNFRFEEVKACHAAIITLVKRDRRNAEPGFETAGMMPTDSRMAIRGVFLDRSRPAQSFRYECQWDGDRVVVAAYR